jgi:hypothetical protein
MKTEIVLFLVAFWLGLFTYAVLFPHPLSSSHLYQCWVKWKDTQATDHAKEAILEVLAQLWSGVLQPAFDRIDNLEHMIKEDADKLLDKINDDVDHLLFNAFQNLTAFENKTVTDIRALLQDAFGV